MPNFITSAFTPPQLPFEEGGYKFLWEVKNARSTFVMTQNADSRFFISIKQKEGNCIIKGEKISRPSQVLFLQQALLAYASKARCEPVFSNLKPASNRQKLENRIVKNIDFFADNQFSEKDEVYIEVGFGSGRHLLHQAKINPQKTIIGVEIHKPSLEQVAKQCEILGLTNVILIDYDSRILMEFLASNSVERIFVHFPVPWDKKPHRRVISEFFTNEALRVLKKGGTLELRTDSEFYFEYGVKTFLANARAEVKIFKNFDLQISSKYEDRWKRLEKNIYDVILTNHEISETQEPPRALDFDFLVNIDKIAKDFAPKLFRGEDFFVHLETLHAKDDKIAVIKTAFGANERAENLFVIIEEGKASYFPNRIYATKANKMAHEIIKKWLNG